LYLQFPWHPVYRIRFLSQRDKRILYADGEACAFRLIFPHSGKFDLQPGKINFIFSRLDSFHFASRRVTYWSAKLGQMRWTGNLSHGGYSHNRIHTRNCLHARTHVRTHTRVSERAFRADVKLEYKWTHWLMHNTDIHIFYK